MKGPIYIRQGPMARGPSVATSEFELAFERPGPYSRRVSFGSELRSIKEMLAREMSLRSMGARKARLGRRARKCVET